MDSTSLAVIAFPFVLLCFCASILATILFLGFFGSGADIFTIEDIAEELVGEIWSEHDDIENYNSYYGKEGLSNHG
jgi:hypothetical protein